MFFLFHIGAECMTRIKVWKEKGYFLDVAWLQMFGRTLPSLLGIVLRYPRLVKQASRAHPDAPMDLKPKKIPYTIPKYKEGMKVCRSEERFLRPTFLCNPLDERIIALAHELGAFKKSEWKYAASAHQFVMENIRGDFSPPKSAVETLLTGHGTCIDKMNLFNALCRAGGIKARYHLYSPEGVQELYDVYMSADPLIKKWYDALGFFVLHGHPEAFVDGKWTPCDVSVDLYHLVAAGHPLTHFGDDPTKTMMRPVEESLFLEGLPLVFKVLAGLPFTIFKGTGRAINLAVQGHYDSGKKILENMSLEEYDKMAKKTYKPQWTESGSIASRILKDMK